MNWHPPRRALGSISMLLLARPASSGPYWSAPLVMTPCFVASKHADGHFDGHHAGDTFPTPDDCVSGNPRVGFEFGCCHVLSAFASRGSASVAHVLLQVHDLHVGRNHPLTKEPAAGPLALRGLWAQSWGNATPFPRGKGTDDGDIARAATSALPPMACDFSVGGHSSTGAPSAGRYFSTAGTLGLLPLYLGVMSPLRVMVATCPLPPSSAVGQHLGAGDDALMTLHLGGPVGTFHGHPIELVKRESGPAASTPLGAPPSGPSIFMFGGLVHHGVEGVSLALLEDAALYHRALGVDGLRLYLNDDGSGSGAAVDAAVDAAATSEGAAAAPLAHAHSASTEASKRSAAAALAGALGAIRGVEVVRLRDAGHQILRTSTSRLGANLDDHSETAGGAPSQRRPPNNRRPTLPSSVGCIPAALGPCNGRRFFEALDAQGFGQGFGRLPKAEAEAAGSRRWSRALGTSLLGASAVGASGVAGAMALRALRRGAKVVAQYRLLQDALYFAKHWRGGADVDSDWFLQADMDEVFAAAGLQLALETQPPNSEVSGGVAGGGAAGGPSHLRRLLDAFAPPDADFVSVRSRKVAYALPDAAPGEAPGKARPAGQVDPSGPSSGSTGAFFQAWPAAAPSSMPLAPLPASLLASLPAKSPLATFSRCFRTPTDLRSRDACDAPLSWLIGATSFDPATITAAPWPNTRDPALAPAAASSKAASSSELSSSSSALTWGLTLAPAKRSAATDDGAAVAVDHRGRLGEGSGLGRAKWHPKYAARAGRVAAALIHAAWGGLRGGGGGGVTIVGEAVGVDADPARLVMHHYRGQAAAASPHDPRAVCASEETQAGSCGASGRTANASCGFAWCCLVPCPAIALAWSPQAKAAAARRFARTPY